MNYRSLLKALCSVLVLCFSFVACEPEPPVTGGGNTGGGNTGNKVTYFESGLYMGITGFNTDVKRYVYDSRYFRILSESSATDFKNFVNGLNIDMATVLYYAVDDALTNMEGARFPDDLNNVAIVTFTDGLDQGSPFFGDQYANANAVNQHLLSARVNNLPITGYAIGLKGKDVKDDAKFKANLTALSTSPANALEVKDMNEVDAIFQEIAASLYNETQSQSISLTVPMQADGVKTRFTFEGNLANESQSNCYIEGTWSDGTLTSITYVGMTCSSGSTVKATANGVLFTFTFEDVKKGSDGKGGELSTDKAQVWNQDPGSSWTPNSEFDPSKYSQTIVEQKSALIMLVLDCSSSLGEEGLSQIKNAANNFIETLRKATSPDYCKVTYDANRGSGNMSTQLFKKGSAQALNANTFTREGYKFAGWNTQPDGTGTHYTDQQKVTLNGNTTLYAQWNAAYTVTFDANGGNGTMQSQPFEHGKSQKLTANSFTRSGYTFTGWNTKADGSGTSYTNGQTITPTANLTLYAQWKKGTSGTTAGHDWVDLGLSVKWATTNVGASKPEGYGTFYTYEEAQERLWTSPWRTPTYDELAELRNECTWKWTTQNGVNGYKVTGPNGNSIFLPAAGYRYCNGNVDYVGAFGGYWSSTPLDQDDAWDLGFHSSIVYVECSARCYGHSVRLVQN